MNVQFRYEINGLYAFRTEKDLETNKLYILRQ
jgi:hypothetical protein